MDGSVSRLTSGATGEAEHTQHAYAYEQQAARLGNRVCDNELSATTAKGAGPSRSSSIHIDIGRVSTESSGADQDSHTTAATAAAITGSLTSTASPPPVRSRYP